MSEPNPEGIQAARRFARWHIGDSNWADLILGAYNDPALANELLDKAQE